MNDIAYKIFIYLVENRDCKALLISNRSEEIKKQVETLIDGFNNQIYEIDEKRLFRTKPSNLEIQCGLRVSIVFVDSETVTVTKDMVDIISTFIIHTYESQLANFLSKKHYDYKPNYVNGGILVI
tara:strand:+ start:35992 stop:36366 length:375 start_codon:yes stop_codon:yes gene_type:complete